MSNTENLKIYSPFFIVDVRICIHKLAKSSLFLLKNANIDYLCISCLFQLSLKNIILETISFISALFCLWFLSVYQNFSSVFICDRYFAKFVFSNERQNLQTSIRATNKYLLKITIPVIKYILIKSNYSSNFICLTSC